MKNNKNMLGNLPGMLSILQVEQQPQTPQYNQPVPQPQKKPLSGLKIAGIIIGSIFLVLIILFVIGIIIFGTVYEESEKELAEEYDVEVTFVTDDWEYGYGMWEDVYKVKITVKNTGTESLTLTPVTFKVIDTNGGEYMATNFDEAPDSISSGSTATFWVRFEINAENNTPSQMYWQYNWYEGDETTITL